MESTDYNGWTNRETWLVNLWVTNDEPTYRMMSRVRLDDPERCKVFVTDIIRIDLLSSILKDIRGDGMMDIPSIGLKDVNWEEICEAWNEG